MSGGAHSPSAFPNIGGLRKPYRNTADQYEYGSESWCGLDMTNHKVQPTRGLCLCDRRVAGWHETWKATAVAIEGDVVQHPTGGPTARHRQANWLAHIPADVFDFAACHGSFSLPNPRLSALGVTSVTSLLCHAHPFSKGADLCERRACVLKGKCDRHIGMFFSADLHVWIDKIV
jgi:hypothetical protein